MAGLGKPARSLGIAALHLTYELTPLVYEGDGDDGVELYLYKK